MQFLDLSFVSEALPGPDLSRAIQRLPKLEHLALPRAGKISAKALIESIPANLLELRVNTSMVDYDDGPVTDIPNQVTRLELSNYSELNLWTLGTLLVQLPKLESLKIHKTPPFRISSLPIDMFLLSLDYLRYLSIPIDLIGPEFFTGRESRSQGNPCPLTTIELECRQPMLDRGASILPEVIWDAVTEGPFSHLRRVGLHRRLDEPARYGNQTSSEDLSELLKALAREDGDKALITEDYAGVYILDD